MADTDSSFTGFPIATRETNDITATQAMDAIKGVAGAGLSSAEVTDIIENAVDNRNVMTEAEASAIWAQNQEKYAASDFVHFGKHRASIAGLYESVNEGITTHVSTVTKNGFRLGWVESDTVNTDGGSKTVHPVLHAVGAVVDVTNINDSTETRNLVSLPQVPNGTKSYDSATGTVTDHLTYVDPKYGTDAGGSVNEAVARAFEGYAKNGDMRFAFGTGWTGAGTISSGQLTVDNSAGGSNAITSQSEKLTETGDYIVEVYVESISGSGSAIVVRTADAGFASKTLVVGKNVLEYTLDSVTANPNMYFQTYATGVIVVSSVRWRKATNEVVTERVDLVGLEVYDEEITDDEVFPFTIQNQSTTFGDTDVPTVLSTRPDSYFQVYDGQTGISKGRCVKWSTLTEVQKRKVAEYLGESFYKGENGLMVQRRIRQRSIAGAGNGDWQYSSPVGAQWLQYADNDLRVHAQGIFNTVPTPATDVRYIGTGRSDYDSTNRGVFQVNGSTSVAYKGRCWFYVIATVPRLNQGAYHPSLNEMGAARWNNSSGGGSYWYVGTVNGPITHTAQAFNQTVSNSDIGIRFTQPASGSISSTQSGRPDDKFYDAIYASGQGGVIDHRHSLGAWKTTPEKVWEQWENVKNGSYRGEEKLRFSVVAQTTATDSATNYVCFGLTNPFPDLPVGGALNIEGYECIIQTDTATYYVKETYQVDGVLNSEYCLRAYEDSAYTIPMDSTVLLSSDVVVSYNTGISVSGEFTQTDVIGDPANILLTDALKDGWLGSWIPVIPDGTNKGFPFTRKVLAQESTVYTLDNGTTWVSSYVPPLDSVTNSFNNTMLANTVLLTHYTAFAKQTTQSSNKAVKWGKDGLGDVWTYNWHDASQGNITSESLLGVIIKNNAVGTQGNIAPLISYGMQAGKLQGASEPYIELPTHPDLTLVAPNNDSSAIKALPYIFEENGQITLGFIANELKHSTNSLVQVTGSSLTSDVAIGETFRITDATNIVEGTYIKVDSLGTNTFDTFVQSDLVTPDADGNYVAVSDGSMVWQRVTTTSNWGDDSTVKVIEDGTYTNDNGETCKADIHELAIPLGWDRNEV